MPLITPALTHITYFFVQNMQIDTFTWRLTTINSLNFSTINHRCYWLMVNYFWKNTVSLCGSVVFWDPQRIQNLVSWGYALTMLILRVSFHYTSIIVYYHNTLDIWGQALSLEVTGSLCSDSLTVYLTLQNICYQI